EFYFESQIMKCLFPFLTRPVVVRQHHSMRCISDEIHEAERGVRQESFPEMILYYYALHRDTCCLSKEDSRVDCVMKHIHKHNNIKTLVGKWDRRSIKLRNWN